MALLKASLSFFPLPDLLRFLVDGKRSAVVTIRGVGSEEEVRIDEGRFASAKLPPDRGVRFARDAGLAPDAIERLGELLAATKGRLTGAALEKKIIKVAELSALETAAVTEALVCSLQLEDGDVEVNELGEPSLAGTLDLTLESVLAAAEARRKETEAITPDTVFRTAGEPDLDKVTLTAAELKVLLRVNGERNAAELAGGGEVGETVAVLEKLLSLGIIERGEERAAPPAAAPAPTPEPAPGQATTLSGRPVGGFAAACLTLHDTDKTSFPLFDAEYTVGREETNDIAIPHKSISARHALLRRTPAGYEIEDLGSRNGTFVNGERVEKALLRNDDALRLGIVQMVYTIAQTTRPADETRKRR